jgi:hypothetical protein
MDVNPDRVGQRTRATGFASEAAAAKKLTDSQPLILPVGGADGEHEAAAG